MTHRPSRVLGAAAAGGFALAGAGCGEEQTTLDPASRASTDISNLWWGMLVGSVVVFAVVLALVVIGVLARRGEQPSRFAWMGTPFVAIAGVAIPAVILIVLFAATLAILPDTSPAGAGVRGEPQLVVDVTGRQWFWDVTYPGRGVRTANEIHIPVGIPVQVRARTADVIHSLWVPQLNRKIDMIPGRTNEVTWQATRAGAFRGQCAEFCGLQHAHMAIWVVAQPKADFDRWLEEQARPAPARISGTLREGQQVFLGSACVYCHRIAGTNASGTVGPDLTHVASRRSLAAGTLPNTKGYLAGWILDPQHVKPGNKMPGTDLSGEQLQVLLDYLESLR